MWYYLQNISFGYNRDILLVTFWIFGLVTFGKYFFQMINTDTYAMFPNTSCITLSVVWSFPDGSPSVEIAYSAMAEYDLQDMSPDSFLELTDRFVLQHNVQYITSVYITINTTFRFVLQHNVQYIDIVYITINTTFSLMNLCTLIFYYLHILLLTPKHS